MATFDGMQIACPLDRKRPGVLVPTHVDAGHFEFEIEFPCSAITPARPRQWQFWRAGQSQSELVDIFSK